MRLLLMVALRIYNLSFLGSSCFMVGQVNFCRDPPDRPPSAGGVKRVCKHRKRLITKGFIAAEWPRRAVPHVCVGGVAAFRGWMAVVYFVLRSPKRQLGGLAERLRRVSSINSASSSPKGLPCVASQQTICQAFGHEAFSKLLIVSSYPARLHCHFRFSW